MSKKQLSRDEFVERWAALLKQERDGWIEYNCEHLVEQMLKEWEMNHE